MYNTHALKPINGTGKLHNGTHVTVPVFDTKQMMISLLSDETLLEKNIAEGYNVFTGDIEVYHPSYSRYGEVHTGDA